jgi:hypothetical protein
MTAFESMMVGPMQRGTVVFRVIVLLLAASPQCVVYVLQRLFDLRLRALYSDLLPLCLQKVSEFDLSIFGRFLLMASWDSIVICEFCDFIESNEKVLATDEFLDAVKAIFATLESPEVFSPLMSIAARFRLPPGFYELQPPVIKMLTESPHLLQCPNSLVFHTYDQITENEFIENADTLVFHTNNLIIENADTVVLVHNATSHLAMQKRFFVGISDSIAEHFTNVELIAASRFIPLAIANYVFRHSKRYFLLFFRGGFLGMRSPASTYHSSSAFSPRSRMHESPHSSVLAGLPR